MLKNWRIAFMYWKLVQAYICAVTVSMCNAAKTLFKNFSVFCMQKTALI